MNLEEEATIQNEELQAFLKAKYSITGFFYDILDYPWERQYRNWRPKLLSDVRGKVLEAGVGTGRNLEYYHSEVELTAFDLSERMLAKARSRSKRARCKVDLMQEDATQMSAMTSEHYDWVFSSFMCCVMPDRLQPFAISQFERVLKPGGRFRILEMVFSKDPKLRKRQNRFAPFVEKVYGARFDRNTKRYIEESSHLSLTKSFFLKADTYLVLEGVKS